tara:strand:- start:653 stop:892 length:240 start_codon:yes stop_codon:yes gene_type:complete
MDDVKEKKEQILKAKNLFEKADLENKVISLAEKAAKNGFYDESIGLLDNLLHMGAKNTKKIASLAVKYQKEFETKQKAK